MSCAPDLYCVGGNTASECPVDSGSVAGSSDQLDCTCDGGYSGEAGGPCEECVAGTFCSGGDMDYCPVHSLSTSGSDNLDDCVCLPSYFGPNGGNCTECTANSYCPGGDVHTSCANADLESPRGSNSSTHCICIEGMHGPANGDCEICPVGSWCHAGVMLECPSNTTTVGVGKSDINDCQCNVGYTYASFGACKKCNPGEFKSVIGAVTCTGCTEGTYSTVFGATSITSCEPCPTHTWSASHSDALLDCHCNAGYKGAGGDGCTACIAGTFKVNPGDSECTECDAKKYSTTVGATSSDTCMSCSEFAFSNRGSDAPSACVCQGGYYDPAQ